MKSNYNRSIELNCPACGSKQFVTSDENATCANCKAVFTRQQLEAANKAKIDATLESTKKEVIADVKADFQKMLKKSFGKNFKIK